MSLFLFNIMQMLVPFVGRNDMLYIRFFLMVFRSFFLLFRLLQKFCAIFFFFRLSLFPISTLTALSLAHSLLHILELINTTLCVALANLAQCLIFVASLTHIFTMDFIVDGLLCFIYRLGQIHFQCLQLIV